MVRALAELPAGTARSLLADVTRLARPLFARLGRGGTTATSSTRAHRAGRLGVRGRHRPRHARREPRAVRARAGAGPPPIPPDWLDALARSERARDALVQRLLEAMTVLGRLQSQATSAVAAEDGTLAEVTRELRAEAEAQAAAAREIAQLLGGSRLIRRSAHPFSTIRFSTSLA